MTFVKNKIRIKMRRKAWRPLILGVKSFMLYKHVKPQRYSVIKKNRFNTLWFKGGGI